MRRPCAGPSGRSCSIAVMALWAVMLSGCEQNAQESAQDQAPAPAASAEATASPAGPKTAVPAEPADGEDTGAGSLGLVLKHYEQLRTNLAGDDLTAAAQAAKALSTAAEQATQTATASQGALLKSLAGAAGQLATLTADDEEAFRNGFGQVSEPLIGLLQTTPGLRKGLHLFECPMADGYGQWVQPQEEISNPYMGQRMPRCGSARSFGAAAGAP